MKFLLKGMEEITAVAVINVVQGWTEYCFFPAVFLITLLILYLETVIDLFW